MGRGAIKEKVRFYTEMVKLGTVASITVGGGGVSLLLNLDSGLKAILFLLSILLALSSVAFTVSSFLKSLDYMRELERLNEGGE
ncbi:hypothetical protein [Hydrogenivirga sp. 128-5-R1-1]|uniref:hypothetical protein n=1 Tax=Hydrogenivirga sp. 128-5-R1-1 TaxID=392423 RepID=UPI00015F1878|nr:hypothetical protein [Hydrogenivirga sp. 128-5-R1-1]EDP75544.1 excinuclease ABC subunit B [Hydrogenivirga sp. 128-5-R1-1]